MKKRFPTELQKLMIQHRLDYEGLSQAMYKRGFRITKQFLNYLGEGKRVAPALQVGRISETLGLTDYERRQLYRAAAIDHGFEIEP